MRTLTLITLLSAACVLSAGPVQAQRGRYVDAPAHLIQALANFSQQASRIQGGGIGQAVNRFQRTMRRQPGNLQVLAQRYGEVRSLLHAAAINDVQILDAWDEVVHSYHEYAEAGGQVGFQPPHQGGGVVIAPPPPNQGHQGHFFQGTFENTPVSFAGNSPDEVFQRCSQFMAHSRISQVDDISVNGQRYRNGPSFWQNDALCSIAALNSAPAHTVQIRGDAEGTPFAIGAGQQRVLQIYLPRALAGLNVDDLTINGQAYHNQASFWGPNEVLNMVLSQSGVPQQNRVRRRRPRR
ncbi:MAG: hypothetical protein ACI9KE_000622 [Polyangiales bacterium]|jgi:uncharacterized protein YukE